MHRFFVPAQWLAQSPIVLEPPTSHQLSRVLRMEAGSQIILLGNDGLAHQVELDSVSPARCTAHLIETFTPQSEPRTRITLCQALPKGKKLDWILQKGTELGMAALTPMITERSIVQDIAAADHRKAERWHLILTEAAEQSGRAFIPQINPTRRYGDLLAGFAEDTAVLIAAPEGSRPLSLAVDQIAGRERIAILIGPEGGLSPQEVALAVEYGAIPISLGPRILRTETAGMAVLAMLLFALGEMD